MKLLLLSLLLASTLVNANASSVNCSGEFLTSEPGNNPKVELKSSGRIEVLNLKGKWIEGEKFEANTEYYHLSVTSGSADDVVMARILNKTTGISTAGYLKVSSRGEQILPIMMFAEPNPVTLGCINYSKY
jgi:hypothetical protein